MFRVYCDRCKKQCKSRAKGFFDKAQEMKIDQYICGVDKIIKAEDGGLKNYPNDLVRVDLCEKCQKELDEVVTNFMKAK